jgi:hypothetical protein
MITNEQVKAWLLGVYTSKDGSNYFIVLYEGNEKVEAEYFLTFEEALAAAESHKERFIFLVSVK